MASGAKAKANGTANSAAFRPKDKLAKAATPFVDDAADKGPAVPRVGRPDKAAYDAEQEALNVKIAELQERLSRAQTKIKSGSNVGPGAERRAELRSEWDTIRQDQSKFKNSRGQIMTQLTMLNEGIAKKIKDLQTGKSKTQFKSVADIEAHIKHLEKQVESGSMKLVDEKRALQEISQCKRLRKTVENIQADQESIEADRAAADELRKQLDDPEAKAVSERADAIKAELDQIRRDSDEAYANRNKLFDERNEVKAQIDELYRQKRESALKYREDNDHYRTKVNEDRARRAEKARAQRQAEEEAKKKEIALRLREEAEAPAYQLQIEDCKTLIDYFSGKTSGSMKLSTSAEMPNTKGEVAGVPKLELRRVDAPADGLIARKKKGKDDEAYFVGGKGKKGKKSSAKVAPPSSDNGAAADAVPALSSSGALNVSLPTLAALLALSIPPPTSAADVPRMIEDLITKKTWFEANQAHATAENVAKAEANIQRLMNNSGKADAASDTNGEKPPEPAPTPATPDGLETSVPADEVDVQLEEEAQKVAAATTTA